MPEDMGERTEQPTGKRVSDARMKGQLPKSQDLTAGLVMLGATVAVIAFGIEMLSGMAAVMRYVLGSSLADDLAGFAVRSDSAKVIAELARLVLPVMLVMTVVAYAAQISQVGFLITTKTLQPNLNRLNVIKGVQRLFSKRTLVKGAMDLAKLMVMGGVVAIIIWYRWPELIALAALPMVVALPEAAWLLIEVALWSVLILILLGVLDYLYQRWQTTQDLKMTKQEVKDERKSTDGDPEVKGRRMRMARDIAMQRLHQDVPGADVVVANPTHFAVALRYDETSMHAPRVIAKGADYLALKIRYIAAAHAVPIVERPPLARALYYGVDIGQEIRTEHYEAVAEVLAYVYRLEGRAAS